MRTNKIVFLFDHFLSNRKVLNLQKVKEKAFFFSFLILGKKEVMRFNMFFIIFTVVVDFLKYQDIHYHFELSQIRVFSSLSALVRKELAECLWSTL